MFNDLYSVVFCRTDIKSKLQEELTLIVITNSVYCCNVFNINDDDCLLHFNAQQYNPAFTFLGSVFWEAKSAHFVATWNSFNVVVMPDFTGDGVSELVTAHSSDPRFPPEVKKVLMLQLAGCKNEWQKYNPTNSVYCSLANCMVLL